MNTLLTKLKTVFNKVRLPKPKLPKINLSKVTLPKIKIPNIKPFIQKIKFYIFKVIPVIKKIGFLLIKIIKGFISWFWKAVKESIAQVWTLLGFFIAWLTLTGTAQQIVGLATIAATILWLITIPLREEKEE